MTEPSPDGPTIAANLVDGPLEGRSIDAAVVQGRPPSTVEVADGDGGTCRYCLTQWEQGGPSALYSFLYRV
jgi:hypothetical protein